MFRYPFTLISGNGLGTSYSSLKQTGSLLPNQSFGQAGINVSVNVATGNLVVHDHAVKCMEMNGPQEFQYVYNSQAANTGSAWRLALKQFTQLPNPRSPSGTATLIEADGHATTYETTDGVMYVATGLENGTPYLYWNTGTNQWFWYHPGTKVTEVYNPQGYLISRSDVEGRTTTYSYDANNELSAVVGPTGDTYQILRNDQTVAVYQVEDDTNILLQTYQFDTQGRLTSTTTPDGYIIKYSYANNQGLLTSITQADGTSFTIDYQLMNGNQNWVSELQSGANNRIQVFYNYGNTGKLIVEDSFGSQTQIVLDNNQRVSQVIQETGYNNAAPEIDTTTYTYANTGQLASITRPDQNTETFQYNQAYGLISSHAKPNGQVTNYYYSGPNPARPDLISTCQLDANNNTYVTRYTYDNDFDGLNQNHVFQRFTISPEGRVTENRTNSDRGTIDSVRTYLTDTIDLSGVPPQGAISLAQMVQWVGTQDPQQVSLAEFTYDYRGQTTSKTTYANIDQNGNGIQDAFMGVEQKVWDAFGNYLTQQVLEQATSNQLNANNNKINTERFESKYDAKQESKSDKKSEIKSTPQDNSVYANTYQAFDSLNRITSLTDALNNVTSYDHQDTQSQIQITRPNGRVETSLWNNQALTIADQAVVTDTNNQQQTRLSSYQLDLAGRPVITTLPDGRITYSFYDTQNRLGFTVSATGIVTEYRYDRVHDFHTKIQYNNPINVAALTPYPNILPLASTLINLLTPCSQDRLSYKFFDASGRLTYQVDANLYVTQFLYDELDRKIGKVAYATALTPQQFSALQNNQAINLQPNPMIDRYWQYFYDNDNKLIGKQDPAGYVTEYTRDAGGRITQRVQYATPNSDNAFKRATSLKKVRPKNSPDDAYTYYFYDARGQRTCEVAAEGYITTRSFSPNGLVLQSIRYMTPVDDTWYQNPTTPPTPQPNAQDLQKNYTYDLLDRVINVTDSTGKSTNTDYDCMGNITLNGTFDEDEALLIDPDHQRSWQKQYDGWDQTTADANYYVAQALTEIENNNNLSPGQKQAAVAEVWADQSLRYTFDTTGLKLYGTDTQGNITYYYYDQERRLAVTVDPTGAIKQNTFDSFNGITATRVYVNRVDANTLATLTGGFITTTFSNLLTSLQSNQDAITGYTLDLRGQVIEKTDPDGNVSSYGYTAFKQCDNEIQPLNNQQKLAISRLFDGRGLEINTTKTGSDGMTAITLRYFQNLYGKLTMLVDAGGGVTEYSYDTLGRVTSTTNALDNTCYTQFDALNRISQETDYLGQVTQHTYDQTQLTHTIYYPVSGSQKMIHSNIFGEATMSIDALGNIQQWGHAPDGKTTIAIDPLQYLTLDNYNWQGWRIQHQDTNGVETAFAYNGAGQLNNRIDDEGGLNLNTTYQTDALGRNAVIIDPRNVATNNGFDPNSNLISTIIDPNGLNLLSQPGYNAQNDQTSFMRGDTTTQNESYTTYQRDSLDRAIGQIVDPITPTNPNGLNLQTQQQLDLMGRVIANTDPNNNTTWSFYDLLGQLRFKVDPMGGVKEWNYNANGKALYERVYDQAIDTSTINAQTTLSQLEALVTATPQDTLTWHFYDANNCERFAVDILGQTNQGIVHEKRYDLAMREIQTVHYATQIDATHIATMTTAELVTLMQNNTSVNDRNTYYILDDNGQQCFKLDPLGAVTEQVFDGMGRVIASIAYFNPVSNPAVIAQLPPDQVVAALTLDSARDRTTYTVFDSMGRILFTVAPEGNVTGFTYDANGNKLTECHFATLATPPSSYAALVQTLASWQPDPQIGDRLTQYQYDNANRLKVKIDALGNSDSYDRDDLGNILTHTDRANNVWSYTYDRAGRQKTQLAPNGNNPAVQRITTYDPAGNILTVTEAAGLPEQRVLQSAYDKCNRLLSTQLVGDPLSTDDDPPLSPLGAFIYNAKGQKVAQQDVSGLWTFYVYDEKQRLLYQVDNMGYITETDRSAFGDNTTQTRYAVPLPNFNPNNYLQNGIARNIVAAGITPTPGVDQVKTMSYDQCGNMLTLNWSNNTLSLRRKKDGDDVAQVQLFAYDAFGQMISQSVLINGTNNQWANTVWWRDRNGNLVAQSDPNNQIKWFAQNVFNQVEQRTEIFNPLPAAPSSNLTLAALAQEVQDIVSAEDRAYGFTYDALGQTLTESRLDVVTQAITQANNGANVITDVAAANLTTTYQYNPVQDRIAITTPNGSTQYTYFDPRHNKMAEAGAPRASTDKDGNPITLIPLTTYTINGLNQTTQAYQYQQGAQTANANTYTPYATTSNDRVTTFTIDQLDRVRAKTFDPNGLSITSQQALNMASQPIAETDPNGNVTRSFFDSLNRKRFKVDAMGNVREWNYDAFGNVSYQRKYATAVDPNQLNNNSTLQQVMALVQPGNLDTLQWFFYDSMNRERFRVDQLLSSNQQSTLGIVHEKRYDQRSQVIQTIDYATQIDASTIATMTTAQLITLMQNNSNLNTDQNTYIFRDAKGQAIYIVDPKGFITQQTFDAFGKVIAKTAYATPVNSSWYQNPTLPPQPQPSAQDQTTYRVYNAAGKVEFILYPKGNVTRFAYDIQGNKIGKTQFNALFTTAFTDYAQLVQLLAAFAADPTADRTPTYSYDAANQLIAKTDAMQKSDFFVRNCFGNATQHIDRNGNAWSMQYDNANRVTLFTAPPTTVTLVTAGSDGQLTATQTTTAVQEVTGYDKANNVTSITKGYGSTEARTLNLSYNACNQLQGTTLDNVAIDNGGQLNLQNFGARPENTVTLNTAKVYNPKKLKVCEQNENGAWTFFVFDSLDRPLYQINALGGIVQTNRDAFGNVINETHYANAINPADLTQYIQTGVPASFVEQFISQNADPNNDRHTTNAFDQRNDIISSQKDAIFYYFSNTQTYGTASPEIQYDYDAFRNRIYKATLQTPGVWSEEITLFDLNNKKVADVDPNNYTKIYTLDAFNTETGRVEYANPASDPTPEMTLPELVDTITPSAQDRTFQKAYDFNGRKTSDTRVNVVRQQLTSEGVPSFANLPAQNLVRQYQYNNTDQQIAVTYEDGVSTEYSYYDVADHKIAVTGVARQSGSSTLIPLTYYGINTLGQVASTTRFFNGTASAGPNQLPVPNGTSSQDQNELSLFDVRGLAMWKQDAKQNVTGYTYTPTRKLAREWWELSGNIDEKQFDFDALDRPVAVTVSRNNIFAQSNNTIFDTFGQAVQEGGADAANPTVVYPTYRSFDQAGNCWKTYTQMGNCMGVNNTGNLVTLTPTDLQGLKSADLQSPTQDLSQLPYDQLSTVFNLGPEDLEHTESQRDLAGHIIGRTWPSCYQSPSALIANLPLQVDAGQAYHDIGVTSLSWPTLQESNVNAVFTIWPGNNTSATQTLPIIQKPLLGRYGVDVSNLPSDVYNYQINYFAPSGQQLYATIGTVQFDSGITTNSQSLVAIVRNDNQLYLTGNTTNLTAVEIWQNGQSQGQVPVQPSGNEYVADLSQYASGSYTATPITSNKTKEEKHSSSNQSKPADAVAPLAFTIYTNTPSQTALSREIPCAAQLAISSDDNTQVQLALTIDPAFSKQLYTVSCTYLGVDGNTYTHNDAIVPGATMTFEHAVQTITTLSLSLQLNAEDAIPLYIGEAPTTSTTAGANFPYQLILYVSPWTQLSPNPPTLQYLDVSQDLQATWKLLSCTGVTSQGVILNATGMAPGNYPFELYGQQSTFSVTHTSLDTAGVVYSSTPYSPPPQQLQTKRQYGRDAWNNVVSETDSLGNVTTTAFNDQNKQITRIQPTVAVWDEHGNVTNQQPVTNYGYNLRGFGIGIQDANGNTEGYVLDAAGQQLIDILGDGTQTRTQTFDTLGRVTSYQDARGETWSQLFDQLNQLQTVTFPSTHTVGYGYDELGNRISSTDQDGNTTRYVYDVCNNISARYMPGGQCTSMSYDRNHQLLAIYNPDRSSLTWSRDYFGHALQHKDLSGAIYSYTYDYKGQLHQQTSQGGSHGQYMQIVQQSVNMKPPGKRHNEWVTCSVPQFIPVPGQNLLYTYGAGRVLQIQDLAQGKVTDYGYDSENRRISRQISLDNGTLIRNAQNQYDALGRTISAYDGIMTVTTGYDAVGNRRHISGTLAYDPDYPITSSQWSDFDGANRALIDGGVLSNGQIGLGENQGMALTYQNGFRTSQTVNTNGTEITTYFSYTPDGLLSNSNGTDGSSCTRNYDPAGWESSYSSTSPNQKTRQLGGKNSRQQQKDEKEQKPMKDDKHSQENKHNSQQFTFGTAFSRAQKSSEVKTLPAENKRSEHKEEKKEEKQLNKITPTRSSQNNLQPPHRPKPLCTRAGLFNTTAEQDAKQQAIDKHAKVKLEKYLAKFKLTVQPAFSEGDCFFDGLAQALEKAHKTIPIDPKIRNQNQLGYKKLRLLCDAYVKQLEKTQPGANWVKEAIEKDYRLAHRNDEKSDQAAKKLSYLYNNYLATIQHTASEMDVLQEQKRFPNHAIWGRPHIEGRMLCETLGIRLHVLEMLVVDDELVFVHQLIDAQGVRSVSKAEGNRSYNDPETIHMVAYQGSLHFVPLVKSEKSLTNAATAMASLETTETKQAPKPIKASAQLPATSSSNHIFAASEEKTEIKSILSVQSDDEKSEYRDEKKEEKREQKTSQSSEQTFYTILAMAKKNKLARQTRGDAKEEKRPSKESFNPDSSTTNGQFICNTNLWLTYDIQNSQTTQYPVDAYNPMGFPTQQTTTYSPGIYDDMNLGYAGYDDWQLSGIGGTRVDKYGPGNYSSASIYYDANGMMSGIVGTYDSYENNNNTTSPAIQFDTTATNTYLSKNFLPPTSFTPSNPAVIYQPTQILYFNDVNDNYLGSYTVTIEANLLKTYDMQLQYMIQNSNSRGGFEMRLGPQSNVDPNLQALIFGLGGLKQAQLAVQNMENLQATPSNGSGIPGPLSQAITKADASYNRFMNHVYNTHRSNQGFHNYVTPSQQISALSTLAGTLQFDDPITRISSSFPPPIPPTYAAAAGDTFASIAQRFYGNPNCGAMIAEANGWGPTVVAPAAGDLIKLPQNIQQDNQFNTVTPYDQLVNSIQGSIYPVLQAAQPPPPPHHHHSWWVSFRDDVEDIVVVVVAVAIGNVIGGAVLGALTTSIGLAGATAVGAVAAGATAALVDAAGQGLLVGLGALAHFSLPQALITGLSEGLNFGEVPLLDPNGLGTEGIVTAGMSATQVAAEVAEHLLIFTSNAVLTQLAALKGNISQLNLAQILDYVAVSMANAQIGGMLPNANKSVVNALESNIAINSLDMGINSVLTSTPPNLQYLAAEVIGTTAGEQLTNSIVTEVKDVEAQAPALTPNNTNAQNTAPSAAPYGQTSNAPTNQLNNFTATDLAQAELDAQMPLPQITFNPNNPLLAQYIGNTISQINEAAAVNSALTNAANSSNSSNNSSSANVNPFPRYPSSTSAATNPSSFWNSQLNVVGNANSDALGIGSNAGTLSNNSSSLLSSTMNILGEINNSSIVTAIANSQVVTGINAVGNQLNQFEMGALSDVASIGSSIWQGISHPINNVIMPTLNLVSDIGIAALDDDYSDPYVQQAQTRVNTMVNNIEQGATNLYQGLINPATSMYTLGKITTGGAFLYGSGDMAAMLGEGAEVGAANVVFNLTASPDSVGAMARQAAMLQENIGYNISPTNWFNKFPTIGQEGTFITDYQTISNVLGPVAPNQQFQVGLFSSGNQFSFFKSTLLEQNLGLTSGSLSNGFTFSSVSGINTMFPLSPIVGNSKFLGAGQGLQNGGPELVVDPLSPTSWPWGPRNG